MNLPRLKICTDEQERTPGARVPRGVLRVGGAGGLRAHTARRYVHRSTEARPHVVAVARSLA